MKMNTHVFNARLYVEGLKRLRVLGFGVLILALTTSLLIPLTHMLESDTDYDGLRLEWVIRITEMSWEEFSVATRFMPLLAPMFFYVSFSFLLKRREADVFHAIPYKRTCVYLSFVASALTWVWGIQLLSSLLSAIMWTVDPFATFTASTLWTLTGTSMLLAALLGGFMLLSLTVCGNQQTVILNFFLFALLPRFLIWQFGLVLEDTA